MIPRTTQQERRLERACRSYADKHYCLFLKFVSPGYAGVPDRILIRPDGVLVFVELKTSTGLSPLQRFVHDTLRKWGQTVVTVSTLDEFRSIIHEGVQGSHPDSQAPPRR